MKKRSSLLVLALFLAACAPKVAPPPPAPGMKAAEVSAPRGMVASAHPLASQAGLDILKAGGNAVDAAVAAAFAIGVTEPNATGIGGEGMMVIYIAETKRAIAIDYRSSAPAAAKGLKSIPATGFAAAAVPGTVAGLCLALEKYGTMPLRRVLSASVRLAEDGFAIGPTLAQIINDNFESLAKNEALAAIFCPTGLPLEAGGVLVNPALGRTLRSIASGGRDEFYKGALAGKIAAASAAGRGLIGKEDLAAYRAKEREPVRGSYRGYDLVAAPPPVGGLGVVEIMHILENFDMAANAPLSARRVHIMTEAMKRGNADWRAFVGDPDFVQVPIAGLLSKSYAKVRAAEIDPSRISAKAGSGNPGRMESPSTTSLSVVDRDGNMVALTQTISDFFGAKVVVGETGIILNNELRNFSDSGPNALAPGKRMRTTISPTLVVKDGQPFATLGTPGAARILTTMAILLSNLIDYGMGIQAAIESPRFFPASDRELAVEPRFPPETTAALAALGYKISPRAEYDLFFGGAQGIIITPGTGRRVGGADPRRDGAVLGY
jgi:gamma-glutamyltranspeptidase / glutathione hydrolase